MSNTPQGQAPWPAPPGHPYPAPQQYAMPMTPQTNGLAVASMVLGIIGWIYFLPGILALIFGYVAQKQIRESHGRQRGDGMAIAGIVLGWIWTSLLAFVVVMIIIGAVTGP